jgi:hypothetical protein
VVLHQQGAVLLDRLVLALLLGELAGVDFGIVAFDRPPDEFYAVFIRGLLVLRQRRRGGERQRGRKYRNLADGKNGVFHDFGSIS